MHLAVAIGTILLAGTLVAVLAVGAYVVELRAGSGHHNAHSAAWRIVVMLTVWLVLTGLAAAVGFYRNSDALPPRIPLTILVGGVAVTLTLRTKWHLRVIHFSPLAWPIALQSMRLVIEIGLWQLHRDGIVPQRLTFEGYNYDILVGLTAVVVAFGVGRGWIGKRVAIGWNVVAIGLLVNIVFMATTSAPGPLSLGWSGVPNIALARFPTVWLATFFVPVAIFGHIISLRQLLSLPGVSNSRPRLASAA